MQAPSAAFDVAADKTRRALTAAGFGLVKVGDYTIRAAAFAASGVVITICARAVTVADTDDTEQTPAFCDRSGLDLGRSHGAGLDSGQRVRRRVNDIAQGDVSIGHAVSSSTSASITGN
jgi:hypothetical protein